MNALETSLEPLAIIGIGCLFPGADDFAGYWANICNKVDGITAVPPTHWRPTDYLDLDPKAPDRTYAARGGFLSAVAFNPAAYGIAPNSLEATDTAQLLGMMVAEQALKDAGYGAALDRKRISCVLGVTGTLELVIPLGARLGHPIWRRALEDAGVDKTVADDVVQRISDSYVPWQENSFPGLLGNVVAGRIANRLDLGGTNCVVDAACASSLSALHLAALELQTGRADMVLTGGIDTFNDIFMYMCFSKTPALSPSGNAKPFDAAGDGTILGEGLGVVLLKRLSDARRDGDKVYALLRGIGASSDGKGNAVYAPKAEGQMAALRQAYEFAGVTPDTIELVEAHGTGTRVGDATEVAALTEVYRTGVRQGSWCALGSVKSQIGHTKAAAGAAGLIKAVAALVHKVLPPTIKVEAPIAALQEGQSPFYINAEKRPWLANERHPRRAAVSAFGFGGSNFHCVVEEADPVKRGIDWVGGVQIVAFQDANNDGLAAQLAKWPAELTWEQLRIEAAKTRRVLQPDGCRLLLVVQQGRTDVAKLLATARELLRKNTGKKSWRSPDGIFFGSGRAQGKTVVLFPGQGAQYVGMMRDLACHFPQAHETLSEATKCFAAQHKTGPQLHDYLYPHSAFSTDAKAKQEAALRATEIAQPALGAASLGAWRVLESFGVTVDAAAGHSYGELTALCAAGRLEPAAFHALSQLRGVLMADAGRQGSEAGTMLAVFATQEQIAEVLRAERLELVLANKNAPQQTVLSGRGEDIEKALQAFTARQIRAQKLSVAAAFHSPLVAAAQTPFRAALDACTLHAGRLPVYANTTAQPYPAEAGAARELLAGQLARPVEFVAEIEQLYRDGVRTFVEAGPGARLTGLVAAILGEREHAAYSVDASSGQRGGFHDLACCLAWLAALGQPLQLALWDDGEQRLRDLPPANAKPAFTVTLSGANYVKPKPQRPPTPKPAVVPKQAATAPVVRTVSTSPKPGVSTPTMNGNSQPPPTVQPPALAASAVQALSQALQITRESLTALQRMQEQTANLHRHFLDGQDTAHRTVHLLVEQQQRLVQAAFGKPPAAPLTALPPLASPAPLPAPVYQQPPPRLAPPVQAQPLPAARPIPAPVPNSIPVAPPPVLPLPSATSSRIEQILLEVIAEKTGYPTEMLELDMALDADLGIDSIKRVEILSALQERMPEAPLIKPEHLGTLHNLRQIVAFLSGSANGHAPAPELRLPAPVPVAALNLHGERIEQILLSVIAEKTGYPTEMLELDMALDADLGIDSIKRVEILSALQERLPEAPLIKPEHLGTLHNLRQIVAFLSGSTNGSTNGHAVAKEVPALSARPFDLARSASLAAALERSVVRVEPLDLTRPRDEVRPLPGSEIWITNDDPDLAHAVADRLKYEGYRVRRVELTSLPAEQSALSGLILIAPTRAVDDAFLKNAFFCLQSAGPSLRRTGQQNAAIFMTVSRLDGAFGLVHLDSERTPLDGGLAGLCKTVSHEWPEVRCKALDLANDYPHLEDAASALVEELLLDGPSEVGLSRSGRCTIDRHVQPLALAPLTPPVQPGEVVVVSGGARGVTAEVAVALARAYRPTLVLLGRSEPPQSEPDWLAALHTEPEIKRALMTQSPGVSPKVIGEQYRALTAQRELHGTFERIAAAGATSVYRSVDIRDPAAVAKVLADIQREHGPIRGLIHGAGVLADAKIEDKTAEQFERVYETKVAGLRVLLEAIAPAELRFIALFSSSTGRFGRTGQVDYAIANEVLNKVAQQQARRLPNCRVVSVNWGPWDGGMVTPALKKLFAQEGVGVIGLEAGADYLVRELGATHERAVEIVVLGGLSGATQQHSSVPPAQALPTAFERMLDLAEHPVLNAHVLDNRPVVPLSLMLEWLAHAALHQHPGLLFHGCNDLSVLHGIILDEGKPLTLRVGAGKAVKRDGFFLIPVELRSTKPNGREVLNARAEVVLAASLPPAPEPFAEQALAARPYPHSLTKIYEELLFHGADLQGVLRVDGWSERGIVAESRVAPPPPAWINRPLRQRWLADPLALDVAFQLMILWTLEQHATPSLPCYLSRYRQYRRAFPDDAVRIVAQVTKHSSLHALADLDFQDDAGQLVARIEGYECVMDASLRRVFQRRVVGAV